jgi:hypothetical protein
VLISLLGASAAMAQATVVEVFKSPYCGCCGKWVEHLRQNGFEVKAHDVEDVPAVRQKLGMPDRLGSCHTAKIGGYVVEGHVPAADIQRLLKEKPKALGLSVPSMPPGSPGWKVRSRFPIRRCWSNPMDRRASSPSIEPHYHRRTS